MKKIPFIILSFALIVQFKILACTGWAVVNDSSETSIAMSVLIGKNRDAIPTEQFVKQEKIGNSNNNKLPQSYIGLFANGNTEATKNTQELKAGVNDKGFAITSLSAKYTLNLKNQLVSQKSSSTAGIMKQILSHYVSIQELDEDLKNSSENDKNYLMQNLILTLNDDQTLILNTYPMFYMFADNKGDIAYLEIAPDGTFSFVSNIHKDSNDHFPTRRLTHANEYLSPELLNEFQLSEFKLKPYPSSERRYDQINSLFNQSQTTYFTMDNLRKFANNQKYNMEPNDNLCRTSNSESNEVTMATFIVGFLSLSSGEDENNPDPQIYIKLNDFHKGILTGTATEYGPFSYSEWDHVKFKTLSSFCQ